MLEPVNKPMPRLALVGAGTYSPPAGRLPSRESSMPRVLSLDAHGRILDWMHWQDAVCLYVRGAVAWTMGEPCLTVHGGTNRFSGLQSVIDLHPIVAARGHAHPEVALTLRRRSPIPPCSRATARCACIAARNTAGIR